MGTMKREPYGYLTSYGYKGWVEESGSYFLFATEQEYLDYIKESKTNEQVD